MTDPDIDEAKSALEELSKDPVARRLARERELADWHYKREMDLSRQEGLRDAVLHLCQRFGIEVTEQRQSTVSQADHAQLEELLDQIADHRRWPDS